mgnify:CR=1 FL=1
MSLILDRVADIYRLANDSDNANKESYVVYTPLANTPLNFQPAQAEDIVVAGGVFGQTYVGFTMASGILEGDKLVMQVTGEVMLVKGRSSWMSPDLSPHMELLLVEFENQE